MADVLFIAVTIGFFAIATLLVKACDRIVGPDLDLTTAPDASDDESPADDAPSVGAVEAVVR